MSFEPFLALKASAGSGKTFALALRYVSLVLKGAKIGEIEALTFTNKAANEMKKRIIACFLNFECVGYEAECEELCKILDTTKEELIRLRDARKSEFLRSNLKIQTIDSFFMQIVRSFALNLGLMSDFAVQESSLDITSLFIKNLNDKELFNLAHYLIQSDSSTSFIKHLESLYQNIYEFESKNIPFPQQEKQAVIRIFEDLKAYALEKSTNSNFLKNFDEELKEDFKKLSEKPLIKEFEKKYFEKFHNDELFLQKRQSLIDALNAYARALEEFNIGNLLSLLRHFKETKDQYMKENNVLSFSDGALKALELIKSEDRDLIYFRLDGRITHLLIDEFQDTSILQYEILKPLISELVSGKGVKDFRSFFYVGDTKQSIYGFRNAKKELFDTLRKDFSQIKLDSLDTNYRSQKIIVDFVNEIFAPLYEDYKTQKSLPKNLAGFVRVVQSKEADTKELQSGVFETLLEQIKLLQEKNISLEKICILCWKNKDADAVVEFLAQEGFSAFTQSHIDLEQKACVRVILTYGKFCIFGDKFYHEELKSLLPKTDIKPIKLDLSKSASENVLYIIKRLGLDLSDLALIQFLEYAQNKENFLELLFEPCPLKILPEQRKGISVMTIHKSKGLEFENVIVLDNLSKKGSSSDIMFQYDLEARQWNFHFKDSIRKNTGEANYTNFMQKHEQEEKENLYNALYVAFTRACLNLFIIVRNKAIKDAQDNYSYFRDLNLKEGDLGELQEAVQEASHQESKLVKELPEFAKIAPQKVRSNKEIKNEESYFGLAFHQILEEFDFIDANLRDFRAEILQKLHNEYFYFLSQKRLEEVFERACRLVENEEFKSLVRGKKLFKEQNLSFENEIKQLDLLALDENEAIIIDYKTGVSDKAGHLAQVSFYKKAVEQILSKKTKAFIIYCLEESIEFEALQ